MKTLWGDYYFDKKTKRVYKGAQVRQIYFEIKQIFKKNFNFLLNF